MLYHLNKIKDNFSQAISFDLKYPPTFETMSSIFSSDFWGDRKNGTF
jgi:hypothetical protein